MAFIALGLFTACGAPRPSTSPEVGGASPAPQGLPAERSALVAALSDVIGQLDPRAAGICLSLRAGPGGQGTEPDADLLQRLSSAGPVVRLADCPPTYDRMIVKVDAEGRVVDSSPPPGYVDPHRIEVSEQSYSLPDSAAFIIAVRQGLRGRSYTCRAVHGNGWESECLVQSRWIH